MGQSPSVRVSTSWWANAAALRSVRPHSLPRAPVSPPAWTVPPIHDVIAFSRRGGGGVALRCVGGLGEWLCDAGPGVIPRKGGRSGTAGASGQSRSSLACTFLGSSGNEE